MNEVTRVDLFLFGKPAWELPIENQIGEKEIRLIRRKGKELHQRLNRIADIIILLRSNNWKIYHTLNSIHCVKEISLEDAKKELAKLGISEDEVDLIGDF